MAKLTDKQIIEKLKGLREGDVLIGVGGDYYTRGYSYNIRRDGDGDLFIRDDDGDVDYVNADDSYEKCVFRLINRGVLRFREPSQIKRFEVTDYQHKLDGYSTKVEVTITTDEAGLHHLESIESERNIARLREQKADIERQISEIESGGVA